MQLSWLEDFIELARSRSFSRAAELRCVTHPAFGRRIKALEQWVGTTLVVRSQPLSLTPAGQLFLDAASHAVDVLSAARAQLEDRGDRPAQTLRLATGRTLARTFFPQWYESLQQRLGPFPVAVSTGGAQEVIFRLAAGEADLLVIYSSPDTRLLIDPLRYEALPLARETLLPVVAADARPPPLHTEHQRHSAAYALARLCAFADAARRVEQTSGRSTEKTLVAHGLSGRFL